MANFENLLLPILKHVQLIFPPDRNCTRSSRPGSSRVGITTSCRRCGTGPTTTRRRRSGPGRWVSVAWVPASLLIRNWITTSQQTNQPDSWWYTQSYWPSRPLDKHRWKIKFIPINDWCFWSGQVGWTLVCSQCPDSPSCHLCLCPVCGMWWVFDAVE